jgi:hypothetical protein
MLVRDATVTVSIFVTMALTVVHATRQTPELLPFTEALEAPRAHESWQLVPIDLDRARDELAMRMVEASFEEDARPKIFEADRCLSGCVTADGDATPY